MSEKLYQADVVIYATAYIKAGSQEEANKKCTVLNGAFLEISKSERGDVEVSDLAYDNPDLPDVSLGRAVTVHGLVEGTLPELWD